MKQPPVRMCIVCRAQSDKKSLLRIVRDQAGNISLDETGKAAGRGAYLCDDRACAEKCKKMRALHRAFKTEVPSEVYERLLERYDGQGE